MKYVTNMTASRKSFSMRHATVFTAIAVVALILAGCQNHEHDITLDPVPHVVTRDIQAGIEAHIDEQTRRGNGYFELEIEGTNHLLRLVKVHTEYLATLGPQEHFACVDLVDTKGDVYDVDFFMHGDPGSMKVTKTLPHKFNGKPYFFWQQNDAGTWERIETDQASQKLMGIIIPKDSFEFRYLVRLPQIDAPLRIWIPLPQSDNFQQVSLKSINEPREHRILTDNKFGNKAMYWELDPQDSGKPIDIRYNVTRIEKNAYHDNNNSHVNFLASDRLVPANAEFEKIATEATKSKKTDYQKAKALYNKVIEDIRYAKAGDGWGQGDAEFACDSRHGNCTDFHAYFIALARSINIPARFAIGAALPANRNDGGVDGYHCWIEFYADGEWWPADISEGDKYSQLSSYYFGHHPANRLEFSQGRDLIFSPGPASGPINFFAYPVMEVDGAAIKVPVNFSFTRDI